MKLKVNKKLLHQHLSEATGKVITLKDITNMQTSSQTTKKSSLEDLATQLKAIDGEVYYYVFTISAYKSVVSSLYHVVW